MKNWQLGLGVAIALSLSTFAVIRGDGLSSRDDMNETDERVGLKPRRPSDATPSLSDANRLERSVQRLTRRVDNLQRRLARFEQNAKSPSTQTQASDGASQTASNDALEKAVAKRIEANVSERLDKIASRRRTPRGEWIAPIDELADELKLDAAQADSARRIFDAARDQTFELFKTERADGGSLVDDLAQDIREGMPPPEATKRFIRRIFSERIPGTETKYLDRLIELRGDVFGDLSETLSGSQVETLDTLNIDPLRVETGYDPIREYVEKAVSD